MPNRSRNEDGTDRTDSVIAGRLGTWIEDKVKLLDILDDFRQSLDELAADKKYEQAKGELETFSSEIGSVRDELEDMQEDIRHVADEDLESEEAKIKACITSMQAFLKGAKSCIKKIRNSKRKQQRGGSHLSELRGYMSGIRSSAAEMDDLKEQVEENYSKRLHEQSTLVVGKANNSPNKKDFQASVDSIGSVNENFDLTPRQKQEDKNRSPAGGSWVRFPMFAVLAVMVAAAVFNCDGSEIDTFLNSVNNLLASDDSGEKLCGPQRDQLCDEYLITRLDTLSREHEGQSEHLWHTLLAAALDHVTTGSVPNRPIVIMALYDGQGTRNIRHRAIIKDVAKVYHNVLWPNVERGTVEIAGRELTNVDAETVQRKIEEDVRRGYEEQGMRTVIVYDFDSLPSCSILTFHNLCNNDDAPYLDMAVILAVEKGGDVGSANNKNLEGVVSRKFHERWKDCPEELPPGKIDAILSRVANNVVLLK